MTSSIKRSHFPSNFKFGTATSSYQIEGTKFGRCGPSHWDLFAHQGGTFEKQNGDIACAHMEHWQKDLDLIKDCGLDAYRFSTSWPRIQPAGSGQIFTESLDFYDTLVDGILERELEPHLTLYHWDLPLPLAEKGGWQSRETALRFADYADAVTRRLGDRLTSIATINEPWCVAWLSHYLGHHAPGLTDISAAAKSMHYILLAHGKAMEAMRASGSASGLQNLGIVLNMEYAQPYSERDEDVHAALIQDGIYNRWFADAIFKGAYPADVLEHLSPHMPEEYKDDMELIAQPIDWLGLNYYTRAIIKSTKSEKGTDEFPFGSGVPSSPDLEPRDKTSMGWDVYPEGLLFFLQRLENDYTKGLPIHVTENGMASRDVLAGDKVHDRQRIAYFDQHLETVATALEQKINVQSYFAWSLLDNFEWAFGYDERFGLVHVDFETQTRTPKDSWYWWQDFLRG